MEEDGIAKYRKEGVWSVGKVLPEAAVVFLSLKLI